MIRYNDVSDSSKESFYNRIGSPQLIVAPMVDQSELPYRMMTRKYGAQLVFTQMFNSNSFINSKGNNNTIDIILKSVQLSLLLLSLLKNIEQRILQLVLKIVH